MPIQPWQNIIEAIRNGEPVTAEVANRAVYQLAQRTEHLKTRQDAQDYAQSLIVTGVPLTSTVATGHAVYFDDDVLKCAPAYAAFEYDGGYLRPSKTSNVLGIVIQKDTSGSGVVVIEGLIDPTKYTGDDCFGFDMTVNMLLESTERGVMYLAAGAGNAGKLTSRPGLINVPVCNLIDYVAGQGGHLVVRPPVAGALESQALRFDLTPRPAVPEIVLQCVSNNASAAFSTAPTVGSRVDVYLAATGSLDTISTDGLLLTGTVYRVNNTSPGTVALNNLTLTKNLLARLDSKAPKTYGEVFKADANQTIVIRLAGANTGGVILNQGVGALAATNTSYFELIDATGNWRQIKSTANGLTNLIDPLLPGWLPATSTYFPAASIPQGARYGYNFDVDPILHQLFPEGVVSAYVLHKNGIALSSDVVKVDSNGIWWFDGLNQLPWNTATTYDILPNPQVTYTDFTVATAGRIVEPAELTLCYAKLVSGGVAVVTTLEVDPSSTALTITDPDGNPATSGPLVLRAGFDVQEGTSTEAGFLVVKDVTGFVMKRGPVVEKIVAGENILLTSTNANGQGTVTVSVQGLDGKLEGVPDILAVDDVLVERDPNKAIFYSSMPPARNSSILAKVDVPSYLVAGATYTLYLDIVFVALHSAGATNMPTLGLSWTWIKTAPGSLNNAVNVADGYISPSLQISGVTQSPRAYFSKTTATITDLTSDGTVFFNLARASNDAYTGKLGIVSMRYRFVRNS
jgi:hypothetical protein